MTGGGGPAGLAPVGVAAGHVAAGRAAGRGGQTQGTPAARANRLDERHPPAMLATVVLGGEVRVKRLFAGVVGLSCLPLGAMAEPTIYPPASEVRVHLNAVLQPVEEEQFVIWESLPDYFGAIFVSSDADAAYWSYGYNTLEGAIAMAELGCQATTPGTPEACVLLATSVPVGFGSVSDPDSLSVTSAEYYRKTYLPNQSRGGWGAFVASRMGQFGASWGYGSRSQAETAALKFCDDEVARGLVDDPAPLRRAIIRGGLDRCFVLDVRAP